VFVGVLFAFSLADYVMNTSMYAYDPGFQVDEAYLTLYGWCRTLALFLLSLALMLVGTFALRVYTFWPRLIPRHRNHFALSATFFAIIFACTRHSPSPRRRRPPRLRRLRSQSNHQCRAHQPLHFPAPTRLRYQQTGTRR